MQHCVIEATTRANKMNIHKMDVIAKSVVDGSSIPNLKHETQESRCEVGVIFKAGGFRVSKIFNKDELDDSEDVARRSLQKLLNDLSGGIKEYYEMINYKNWK